MKELFQENTSKKPSEFMRRVLTSSMSFLPCGTKSEPTIKEGADRAPIKYDVQSFEISMPSISSKPENCFVIQQCHFR